MNQRELILVGGGGHCKSVIEVAESAGRRIAGILDVAANVGKKVLGYDIIGTDDSIVEWAGKAEFVVTIGYIKDASVRIRLHEKIKAAGGRLAVLIASTAHVSKHALIGEGSVIMHHALVNADARIGKGCIINTFSNIEHDAVIGNYCHISTGGCGKWKLYGGRRHLFRQPGGHGKRRVYCGRLCDCGRFDGAEKYSPERNLFG